MSGNTFDRPNEEAMLRVLEREKGSITEVIIRLAWELGLTREELRQLKWADISFEEQQVILPDRKIPMEEGACTCLQERHAFRGHRSEYVVIGDRLCDQLTAMSISRLLRAALDTEESLTSITLKDLRYDFIIRQLEKNEWPYVARISGMAATTMYTRFAAYMPPTHHAKAAKELDVFGIWKVLQNEGDSPVGLAIYMNWNLGMQVQECLALTWDQIDMEAGAIRLPDREIQLDPSFRRRLQRVRAGRDPAADPHVLLKPKANRPYTLPEISRATRTALIRGGMEDLTLRDLNVNARREREDALVFRHVREHGCITRKEVMDLFQVSRLSAYDRLRRLSETGKLVAVGGKYYLAGSVVPPEQQYDVIREHLLLVGSAYRKELADLLHVQDRHCSSILKRLVQEGKLARAGQRYCLPPDEM